MNVKNLKQVYLMMGVVGITGPFWSVALSKMTDVGQPEIQAVFFVFLGFALASVLHHSLAEKAYVVGTFRLHGWKDGRYAVQLRVYEDGIGYHTDNRIIEVGDANLPAAPRWSTVKGKPDSVLVCDMVYS